MRQTHETKPRRGDTIRRCDANRCRPCGALRVKFDLFRGLAPPATRLGPFGAVDDAPVVFIIPLADCKAMADEILLNEAAFAVWQTVKERGPIELGEVVDLTGLDQSQVSAAATEAAQRGYFAIEEHQREELIVSDTAAAILAKGLPERLAIHRLFDSGGSMQIEIFIGWAKSAGVAPNEVFKWGMARGWIERVKGNVGMLVVLTQAGKAAIPRLDHDQAALQAAMPNGRIYLDELPAMGIDRDRVKDLLGARPELAKIKPRTQRILSLTASGMTSLRSGYVRTKEQYNAIAPEDLVSGDWKSKLPLLRSYNVGLPADDIFPAKIHPLRKIIEQTRRAFLEMGFAEVVSPMVESAFWNFDALFQPQDHPARDMQDTFYMRDPSEAPLPAQSIVEPVRCTHEDGWETGSEGWGYKWSPERSKQVVLRTHTTAATIRALAANPDPPGKFFCVGWTYRNETISFKHLPVFHQVDGIVVDEEANLASMMGTLQEF